MFQIFFLVTLKLWRKTMAELYNWLQYCVQNNTGYTVSVRKINLCLEEINAKQVNRCVAWNGICFECELNKTQSWVAHLKTLQNI